MLCTHIHASMLGLCNEGDAAQYCTSWTGQLWWLCTQYPAQPGWHSLPGDGRDLAAKLAEKAGAFQVPCVAALSCRAPAGPPHG